MLHLVEIKICFIFSLGLCVLICSTVYFRIHMPWAYAPNVSCRSFPEQCATFLPNNNGCVWQQWDCLTEDYLNMEELKCSQLVQELHFITSPLSQEEEQYPLAFIMTIHKELEMFARLLRAIYAPQNIYCIHVDAKAPKQYRSAVERLTSCFPNVFISTKSERVIYGGFSRLQADIICLEDLAKSAVPWRKVINMCGQDFPIKSNLELVRYFQSKAWRDTNMTPGEKQPYHMKYRTEQQYLETEGSGMLPMGGHNKEPPPHNLELYFGTAYYALTRPFAHFVLNNAVAKDLLNWSRDTYSPDEHYWVTLNHLKGAPGSNIRGGWQGNIRAIKWRDREGLTHDGCKGRYVRDICVFGLEDLQWIIDSDSMFANKFEVRGFPEAVDCLELWQRHKVLRQAKVPIPPEWQLATCI